MQAYVSTSFAHGNLRDLLCQVLDICAKTLHLSPCLLLFFLSPLFNMDAQEQRYVICFESTCYVKWHPTAGSIMS